MSGRQLTISDTIISDLSVVEVNQIQRVAIARLQGMDIGVSFGMLKGVQKIDLISDCCILMSFM